jgi:hypothetical protein
MSSYLMSMDSRSPSTWRRCRTAAGGVDFSRDAAAYGPRVRAAAACGFLAKRGFGCFARCTSLC